jgi:hypothetical protein
VPNLQKIPAEFSEFLNSRQGCYQKPLYLLQDFRFGDCASTSAMTIRIGKGVSGNTVIYLVGRIQGNELERLSEAMAEAGRNFSIDMSEVTIVDADVVRFLRDRETEGIVLLHCSRYVREWISRERETMD